MKHTLFAAILGVMFGLCDSASAAVINVTNSGHLQNPNTSPYFDQHAADVYAGGTSGTLLRIGQPAPDNPANTPLQSNNGWSPYGTTDTTHQWWNIGEGGGQVTFNLSGNALNIIWGSPNNISASSLTDVNLVSFYDGANGGGNLIGSVSVTDLVSLFPGQIVNDQQPGYLIGFNMVPTFNSVVFSTGPTAFEFAFASPVPEPSTWAMMILGFAGVGFMAYRRRSQSTGLRAA